MLKAIKLFVVFFLLSRSWSLTTHHACTTVAIFKTCWQTFSYKHFSGWETIFDVFLSFPLQKMTWESPASQHRTSRPHHHSQLMPWMPKRPTSLLHTCWVKVIQRRTATSARSIIITTTIIIMLDCRTRMKNTRCQRHRQRKSIRRTIRLSTVIKWSDKSTTYRDKCAHGWEPIRKYF